ncbi:DUF2218 domain-containing protein [Novosphingobium lentum]|uniref:DUF2218 domain-containing protein n=1 Tax=Novosphingobium lentum TaxID=145287 RepID=UPI000835DF53|nr:DUF2218 domain-containing protein [Novosphingobium lentum]
MSMISHGFAPTTSGARYVQQLVKHWSHKFATTYADGHGEVPFSDAAAAAFDVRDDGIAITLTTPGAEDDARMRGVIQVHLDRFAFREAPLSYSWDDAA